LLSKPLVQLFFSVHYEAVTLHGLFALVHEASVLLTLKQSWNFSSSQQGIHALQEAGLEHVGLIKDEAQLLFFASSTLEIMINQYFIIGSSMGLK
jgi:hypothetical protein